MCARKGSGYPFSWVVKKSGRRRMPLSLVENLAFTELSGYSAKCRKNKLTLIALELYMAN